MDRHLVGHISSRITHTQNSKIRTYLECGWAGVKDTSVDATAARITCLSKSQSSIRTVSKVNNFGHRSVFHGDSKLAQQF